MSVRPLAGQSTVVGLRDLAFGAVIRGVATTVSPDDPIRSGRFYVRHLAGHQVRIRFTLPNRLTRVGGGGNMRIRFGKTDAVAKGTAPTSVPVYFDPGKQQTLTLTGSPDMFVNLGGQVRPRANQATGTYTAAVVMTCTFF